VDAFPTRFVNLSAARLRFGDRVDRLGRNLSRLDPRADAVVMAIEELPKGEGWRLFEEGLRRGARAIPDAPLAMRELLEEVEHVPTWVDWGICDRGGALLMRAGVLGGAVLGARSLPLGYASPGGNKPLVFSGRLKQQTARRVNETARFVQAVCRPGGMRPFADGWQITVKVRLMHAQVRRMILKSGRWDAGAWGAPINQHDMAGTTLLFSVSIIDGLRHLGMRVDAEEAERYIHLWRWVGRLMGVDYDVLPASETEAMRLAEVIAATMGEPDQDSRELTQALFLGAYDGCVTRKQLRAAERNVIFGSTVCRELLGDELSDKLGVRRSNLRYAMPIIKRLVRSVERFTHAVPLAERSAVAVGSHYWDRVVEIGLRGATAEFGLPERLGAVAA
jgi:ER-bound oxygenase mpaB/B'/Rubber oxygenase, catalytic domain